MAEGKYGKYLFTGEDIKEHLDTGPGIVSVTNDMIQGSNFYGFAWILSAHPPEFNDGPHIHKDAELIIFIGGNPNDPSDLGGETVIHLGPEMERHVITKSTIVFIPPNFIHCPWKITRVDRPFIMARAMQGPVSLFRSMRNLLSKERREKITPFLLFGNTRWEE